MHRRSGANKLSEGAFRADPGGLQNGSPACATMVDEQGAPPESRDGNGRVALPRDEDASGRPNSRRELEAETLAQVQRTARFREPREPRERTTAFVLSGGGNQGVSQVGMLRALFERGVVPDVIVGTSAGALNGAAFATDPSTAMLDRLEEVWLGLTGERVFPGNAFRRAWNILRRDDHLFRSDGLREVVQRAGTAKRFADLKIPLRVVAADLLTGEEVVFSSGPLEPALLGSAALPGIFPPVRHNGRLLADGAVVNLVPISHALAGPIERIFVLDVSDPITERPIRSPLDVVIRAFAISRDQRFDLELQYVPEHVELVVLPPPVDERDFFDFGGGKELVDEAYALTAAALDEVAARPGRQGRRRWWARFGDWADLLQQERRAFRERHERPRQDADDEGHPGADEQHDPAPHVDRT
jgi:NTE family protein